jgi:hypothetical protein
MWGRFDRTCWFIGNPTRQTRGEYFGAVYNFRVRGFFLEVAPLVFGDDNLFFGSEAGPLSRVYGQVGYVYGFKTRPAGTKP